MSTAGLGDNGWKPLGSDMLRCSVRISLFTGSGPWDLTRCSCKG